MSWLRSLFSRRRVTPTPVMPRIFFTNTLTGTKELFVSQKPGSVLLYTCGPTVYGPTSIGNLRAYIFSDTIVRTLESGGYRVKPVINITDFGHLVSDGDEGEDKMTKGLKREKMALTMENMRTLAERYAQSFIADLQALAVDVADITFPRASDYIREQIAFIATLEQKEYAYRTAHGVYFDTSRFPNYGSLGDRQLVKAQSQSRVRETEEKRHPADFVLWKPDAKLGWESPWGRGFPGWHIECSAMSRALLGQEIDIHTGGEDLASVHHNNEIAQSEAASGRIFVHYWMHNAFLTISGEKISKSRGNVFYLADVTARGISPRALRYFFLQAHYRSPLSFSWDALEGAAEALERLTRLAHGVALDSRRRGAPSEARERFLASMRDDLATPQALALLWESLKSEDYTAEQKWALLESADAHLGLSLTTAPPPQEPDSVPREVHDLVAARDTARRDRDFAASDRLREQIENRGYRVEDGPSGTVLTKRTL